MTLCHICELQPALPVLMAYAFEKRSEGSALLGEACVKRTIRQTATYKDSRGRMIQALHRL